MMLAEYMRKHHLGHRQHRVEHPEGVKFEVPTITIPVSSVTAIKCTVLAGIVAAVFVPPQWAWFVVLVTNGYWMFKLK